MLMLGQTDGRTPYRYIDPAPHTMRAALTVIIGRSSLVVSASDCGVRGPTF